MSTVNEITGTGLVYSQVHGRIGDFQSDAVKRGSDNSQVPGRFNPTQQVGVTQFSSLVAAKDEVIQTAQSIRQAQKALGAVDEAMKDLNEAVQLVKNYPPFPQGNEKRIDYINGINGLRRQLEALEIPPVKNRQEVVFYPRESGLPSLDPAAASDEEVLAIGPALDKLQLKVNESYAALQKQAEELPKINNADLPQVAEKTVYQLVQDVTTQLSRTPQSMIKINSDLSQLSV